MALLFNIMSGHCVLLCSDDISSRVMAHSDDTNGVGGFEAVLNLALSLKFGLSGFSDSCRVR